MSSLWSFAYTKLWILELQMTVFVIIVDLAYVLYSDNCKLLSYDQHQSLCSTPRKALTTQKESSAASWWNLSSSIQEAISLPSRNNMWW